MKSSPLKESVKKYIKERIAQGVLAPGCKIPTVRSLSQELNISHAVVAGAFKDLATENVLVTRVGSGTRVAKKLPFGILETPADIRNLYFFFVLYHTDVLSSWHAEILARIQEKAQMKKWEVKIDFLSAQKLLQAAKDPDAIGVIHTTTHLTMPKINLPVVSYGMSPGSADECCVTPDNYAGGAQAVRYLQSRQCEKIIFVTYHRDNLSRSFYPAPHVVERLRGVKDACMEYGLPAPEILRWDVQGNPKEVEQCMIKKQQSNQRIGIIVANRNMAVEIKEKMYSWQIQEYNNFILTTFINRRILGEHQKIDTFDFSRDELAEQCIHAIEQMRCGANPPSRISLKMKLT